MRFLTLLTPFLILFTASCDNEEPIADDDFLTVKMEYPGVEEDFWPYLQLFEQESANRGSIIELSNSGVRLTYKGKDKGDGIVAGSCYHDPEDVNSIVIDSATFSKATRYAQEQIIFHELGHCSLLRGHDDSTNPNGTCKSLMRSDPKHCLLVYNANTRQAYLDELFSK